MRRIAGKFEFVRSAMMVVIIALAVSGGKAVARAEDAQADPQRVIEVMRRVYDYQRKHPYKPVDRNWIRATYYTGVMALYRTTGDPNILAQVLRWAEGHAWAEGTERFPANKKTCGQTYLELYFLERDPVRIAKIRSYVDSRMATIAGGESPLKGWYYCDTLYVGPPTIGMLGKATGEKKYYDYLNEVYWQVADHLFDSQHGLFYRDRRFVDARTASGKKVFWSRGNGWVIAGIPRVLEYLPKNDPFRDRYVDLLRRMSAALARVQHEDGLWRANLADPEQYPGPESSGTAFFCYAMAWGIRHGLLEKDKYLPVVAKAWTGLVRCVDDEGKLGYVQPVGDQPRPAPRESTHEYAMGAFLLAGSEMVHLAKSGILQPIPLHGTVEMPLADKFKRLRAPQTGRVVVQLTDGDAFCYPLYYFIPSISRDAKYLIHHRAEAGQVQLFRLNLRTGRSVQITHGNTPETRWKNWCVESGSGVLDHRSVLNVARGKVIYFTGPLGNDVRIVDVVTLEDQLLFTLPDDREAVGQNCTSPDGEWFVYIDSPRGSLYRQPVKGAKVVAYRFDTQEQRVLCEIDCHIHHVLAYDNEHFIFCHPPNGMGMLLTDLTSGDYEYLRAGDSGVPVPARDSQSKGHVCHFVATARGICYEVIGSDEPRQGQRSGLYDPHTRRRFEFLLPDYFGYTHTGWDPQGRLWFWEDRARGHRLVYLKRLDPRYGGDFVDLTGPWQTYGSGQKSHFHPQLTPDRKWILLTGGDPKTKTNHIFLLDVSDLRDTEGISPALLSSTGANDLVGTQVERKK